MILHVERVELNQNKAQLTTVPLYYVQRHFFGGFMRIVYLSQSFYDKYGHCSEILKKTNRPYLCLTIKLDFKTYAIPLRHHISHPYCFITYGSCGLDYSKAIPVIDEDFILDKPAVIDSKEWNIIKANETKIIRTFKKYLRKYSKALKNPLLPRNNNILRYSTLQYFDI